MSPLEFMARLASIVTPPRLPLTRYHGVLAHEPVEGDDPAALYFDVTGEPVSSWVLGLDPDPDERGPPTDCELVDPPAPEM